MADVAVDNEVVMVGIFCLNWNKGHLRRIRAGLALRRSIELIVGRTLFRVEKSPPSCALPLPLALDLPGGASSPWLPPASKC